MPIKIYKSTRAARKNMSIVDRRDLYSGKSQDSLRRSKRRISGRGSEGKITIRHRGGGAKRNYRLIDFGQEKMKVPATVERIEFDPNRSAFIVLLKHADGERRYRLAWDGARVGDKVVTDLKAREKNGNRMPLVAMTPGSQVHNVELKPGRGGQLLRAAGNFAVLMDVIGENAQLKMSSGEIRLVSAESFATLGAVSNPDHNLQRIGSAGRSRRLGRRPQVRGKAMNPVDHPHGGGEGGSPIGLKHPKTIWGRPALGVKTRTRGKYSDHLILARRIKKKRS